MRPQALTLLLALSISASPAARADVVTEWNATTTAVTLGPVSAYVQIRAYAIVHAAIHDAVNAVERRYAPLAVDVAAPAGASLDAAAAAAAHTVLVQLVPERKGQLDAALAASLSKIPEGKSRDDGLAIGRQVGEREVALRADDGTTAKVELTIPPPGPGVWQLTPGFAAPILTSWTKARPMVIKDPEAFSTGRPPALDSAQFAKDYAEVKSVGARNSKTRTAEQTAVAIFWTTQSMVPWNAAAVSAAKARGLSVHDTARLLALMNIAVYDTGIPTMQQKYKYLFWRPYNAIRAAGGPGQPKLAHDPEWEPLLQTPGHPEYPSGHCVCAGAAAEVLRTVLGDDKVEVAVVHPPMFGVTRRWKSFTEIEKEVENARVWGGIHFRTADRDGLVLGHKVAQEVVRTALLPASPSARSAGIP